MKRRQLTGAALGAALVHLSPASGQTAAGPAQAASASRPAIGEVRPLGNERYQVGRIMVDKRAGSFAVPGRIHVTGKPLEYLATSPGGMKAYETLLELDVSGSELNLAAILIGLEADSRLKWTDYRVAARLPGPRVSMTLEWSEGGQRRRMSAAEAILNPEAGVSAAGVEWVYTASPMPDQSKQFGADRTGTLIGFVHDPHTVFESAAPIGLGAYGTVRGHPKLPAIGTPIELIIEAVKPAR